MVALIKFINWNIGKDVDIANTVCYYLEIYVFHLVTHKIEKLIKRRVKLYSISLACERVKNAIMAQKNTSQFSSTSINFHFDVVHYLNVFAITTRSIQSDRKREDRR